MTTDKTGDRISDLCAVLNDLYTKAIDLIGYGKSLPLFVHVSDMRARLAAADTLLTLIEADHAPAPSFGPGCLEPERPRTIFADGKELPYVHPNDVEAASKGEL